MNILMNILLNILMNILMIMNVIMHFVLGVCYWQQWFLLTIDIYLVL